VHARIGSSWCAVGGVWRGTIVHRPKRASHADSLAARSSRYAAVTNRKLSAWPMLAILAGGRRVGDLEMVGDLAATGFSAGKGA
jgi:hypothetical protein